MLIDCFLGFSAMHHLAVMRCPPGDTYLTYRFWVNRDVFMLGGMQRGSLYDMKILDYVNGYL